MILFPLLVALAVGGMGLALSGCGRGDMYFAAKDAGADGSDCTCVQWPAHWEGPTWVRTFPDDKPRGVAASVYKCEDYGRKETYHGHAGLVAPLECAPCLCQPPIGTCELPSMLTAHDVVCQDLGGPHQDTPFDAPSLWDGGCDDTNSIDGGSGIKSVSVAPMLVKDSCKVGPKIPQQAVYPVSPYWHEYALGCHGENWSLCGDINLSVCVPNDDAPSPEFKLCIYPDDKWRNEPCPDEWPDERVYYGDDIEDHRGCMDCTCGPPVGSTCSAPIAIYSSTMCNSVPIWTLTAKSDMPKCGDVPVGAALGSKAVVGSPTYMPGKCEPMGGDTFIADGGADGAAADPTSPARFCCQR